MAWKTKEDARAYQAKWRDKNREKLREKKRDWYRKKHNSVPREEWLARFHLERERLEAEARQARHERKLAAKAAAEDARRIRKATQVKPVSPKPAPQAVKRKPGRLLALAGWGRWG